jgi:hypothetical protein
MAFVACKKGETYLRICKVSTAVRFSRKLLCVCTHFGKGYQNEVSLIFIPWFSSYVRTDKPAGKLILISVTCCDVRSGKRIEVLLLLRILTSHIASAVFFSVFGIYILKYFMIWRSWLRHCATSQKVAGTIPDGVIGIFLWDIPSGRTIALALTEPTIEMSTRNNSWG